jgi:large subunit ribosomal protein L24
MNKKRFKISWNASVQTKKQRLFRYNAPAHIKGKFLAAHLSKELMAKYGSRSVRVRVGDKVKVMRGQFKNSVGPIERVDSDTSCVYITKVEQVKKDGSKTQYPINASNLQVLELKLDDKYRVQSLTKQATAKVAKAAAPKVASKKQ